MEENTDDNKPEASSGQKETSPRNVTVTFNFPHSGSSSEGENEQDSIEYSEPMNRLTVIGRVSLPELLLVTLNPRIGP